MLLTAKKTHLRGRNGEKGGNVDERLKKKGSDRKWEVERERVTLKGRHCILRKIFYIYFR